MSYKYVDERKALSSKRKKKQPYYLYLLLYAVIAYASYVIMNYDALDLAHYIDECQSYLSMSIAEIIDMRFGWGKYDFIYYALLLFSMKHGLVVLLTATTVFIYFIIVTKLMKQICQKNIEQYVIIAVLFLTPITWTCAMSRNVMAFMFLYCAIYCLYKENKIGIIFFSILGVLTHFSVLLYIVLLVGAFFLKNVKIHPVAIVVILFILGTISYYIPTTFFDVVRLVLSDNSGFYHYTDEGIASFWSSGLGYGDKLPALYGVVYSAVILFLNKKQGLEFWMLFMIVVLEIFLMTVSSHMILRISCFLPLFWGLNIAKIYAETPPSQRTIIRLMSLAAFVPILLHFYAYRPQYFAF